MEKLKNVLTRCKEVAKNIFDRFGAWLKEFFDRIPKCKEKENTKARPHSKKRVIRKKRKLQSDTKKKEQKLVWNVLLVLGVVVLGVFGICMYRWNNQFSYTKCLDEVVFVYDKHEVTLKDLTYYIMIEEEAVNSTAEKYDPNNINAYWNLHLDEGYVSEKAKETALNYCVRDFLYSYKAKKAGIELNDMVIAGLEQKAQEIYNGLTEKQKALKLTQEDIYKALYNNQLADEYVLLMAERDKVTVTEAVLSARYGINSYHFKKTKAELGFVLNKKLWAEISLGSITIN